MAIAPASASLTTVSSPGLTSATSVGSSAAGWGQSALGGLVSVGGIATMLVQGAVNFGRTIARQGGLHRPDPPTSVMDPGYYDYEFWKESDFTLADADSALDAIWIQNNRYMAGLDPMPSFIPASPAPAPSPPPVYYPPSTYPPQTYPDTQTDENYGYTPGEVGGAAAYPFGGKPMSMISTSLGSLGGIFSGAIDLIGDIGDSILPIAAQTAPIWTPFLPQPGGGGGGAPVSALPMSYPGGAPIYGPSVTPAFGLPGVDLAPQGSTPITPYTSGGGQRLPSTVEVPYQTANGSTRYAHYKNMGRPVLYSGDYAAAKRCRKVASKARRRSGGR